MKFKKGKDRSKYDLKRQKNLLLVLRSKWQELTAAHSHSWPDWASRLSTFAPALTWCMQAAWSIIYLNQAGQVRGPTCPTEPTLAHWLPSADRNASVGTVSRRTARFWASWGARGRRGGGGRRQTEARTHTHTHTSDLGQQSTAVISAHQWGRGVGGGGGVEDGVTIWGCLWILQQLLLLLPWNSSALSVLPLPVGTAHFYCA